MRQIFMYNKTVKMYPKQFFHMYVYSFAYIPSFKKTILSTKHGLLTATLDMSRYTSLNSRFKLYDMAVDDDKRIVFMLTLKRLNSLFMMNTINSTFRQLHSFKMTAKSVAIDAKRNICFVSMPNKIISLKYDGKYVKVLQKGRGIGRLTLDIWNNELYFLENHNVKKMSLSHKEVITTKETSVYDLIYDDNVLYIVTSNSVKMVSQNKSVAIYNRQRLDHFKMCLLP